MTLFNFRALIVCVMFMICLPFVAHSALALGYGEVVFSVLVLVGNAAMMIFSEAKQSEVAMKLRVVYSAFTTFVVFMFCDIVSRGLGMPVVFWGSLFSSLITAFFMFAENE